MTKLELILATRSDALRRGDRGVYRSMTAELSRLGYVEPSDPFAVTFPPRDVTAMAQIRRPVSPVFETTEAPKLETAEPVKRRQTRPRVAAGAQ